MTDTFTDEVIEIDYEEMYERALDEIERLVLRIQELENQLDRTRMDNISMAYNLAGPGR